MSSGAKFVGRTISSKTFLYENQDWDNPLLLTKPKNPIKVQFSRDNSYLIIQNTSGSIYIYETVHFKVLKIILSKKPYKMVESYFAYVEDRKILLCIVEDSSSEQILAYDLESANYYPITDFNESYTIKYNYYSEIDRTHFYEISRLNKSSNYREYKIMKVLEDDFSTEITNLPRGVFWDALIYNQQINAYMFVYRFEIYLISVDFKDIIKKVKLSIPNNGVPQFFKSMTLSKNGKFIVIAYDDCVVILDSEHLEIVRSESIPYACFVQFGKDDEFLLIGTWKNGYILENNLN